MKSKIQRARLLALLLPPAGLIAYLFTKGFLLKTRILGVVTTLLYAVIYSAVFVLILIKFAGLQIEWKGGFPPVLTFNKTLPNYDALEKHRSIASKPSSLPSLEGGIYWTQFRGPLRDGHYREMMINTNWSDLKPVWKQPIGGGYSSFSIAKGIAYTIEQRREKEVVAAYDLRTGKELWTYGYPAKFEEWMGGEGPRTTPSWDNGKLYTLGAEGDLLCLEADTGKLVWQKQILREANSINLMYAMSASPLIVEDKVIVLPGGANNNSVVALNKLNGYKVWGVLDDKQAYVSPMQVELAGTNQLLIVSANRVVGLAISDGKLLWSVPWIVQYENNIAQPVILPGNQFLLSAGYGTGSAAFAVSNRDKNFEVKELWRNKKLKNKFSSSVLHDGYIYGLDEDILTCIDAKTGMQQWKDGRYGYGQLILASGHLIIVGGEGDLILVKADPKQHTEIKRLKVLPGKTWNHPAIADGFLLIRNAVEAACFDLRPKSSP